MARSSSTFPSGQWFVPLLQGLEDKNKNSGGSYPLNTAGVCYAYSIEKAAEEYLSVDERKRGDTRLRVLHSYDGNASQLNLHRNFCRQLQAKVSGELKAQVKADTSIFPAGTDWKKTEVQARLNREVNQRIEAKIQAVLATLPAKVGEDEGIFQASQSQVEKMELFNSLMDMDAFATTLTIPQRPQMHTEFFIAEPELYCMSALPEEAALFKYHHAYIFLNTSPIQLYQIHPNERPLPLKVDRKDEANLRTILSVKHDDTQPLQKQAKEFPYEKLTQVWDVIIKNPGHRRSTRPFKQEGFRVAQFMRSQQMEKMGGLVQVANFSGCYSRENLYKYFQSLQTCAQAAGFTQLVTLVLTVAAHHTISISYQNNQWRMRGDSNNVARGDVGLEQITQEVITALLYQKSAGPIIFVTEVAIAAPLQAAFRPVLDSWLRHPEMQALHEVTAENCKAVDEHQGTWLTTAAYSGEAKLAARLLAARANPNHYMRSKDLVVIRLAANRSEEAIVVLLLQNGADPNLQTSILSDSVAFGHKQVVQRLLDHGVDISDDAIKLAETTGHHDIASLMKEKCQIVADDITSGLMAKSADPVTLTSRIWNVVWGSDSKQATKKAEKKMVEVFLKQPQLWEKVAAQVGRLEAQYVPPSFEFCRVLQRNNADEIKRFLAASKNKTEDLPVLFNFIRYRPFDAKRMETLRQVIRGNPELEQVTRRIVAPLNEDNLYLRMLIIFPEGVASESAQLIGALSFLIQNNRAEEAIQILQNNPTFDLRGKEEDLIGEVLKLPVPSGELITQLAARHASITPAHCINAARENRTAILDSLMAADPQNSDTQDHILYFVILHKHYEVAHKAISQNPAIRCVAYNVDTKDYSHHLVVKHFSGSAHEEKLLAELCKRNPVALSQENAAGHSPLDVALNRQPPDNLFRQIIANHGHVIEEKHLGKIVVRLMKEKKYADAKFVLEKNSKVDLKDAKEDLIDNALQQVPPDTVLVWQLIFHGAAVSQRSFMSAASQDRKDIIEMLWRANPHNNNIPDQTIGYLIWNGGYSMAEAMLAKNPGFNGQFHHPRAQEYLHHVIARDFPVEAVKEKLFFELCKRYPEALSKKNNTGQSPLFLALDHKPPHNLFKKIMSSYGRAIDTKHLDEVFKRIADEKKYDLAFCVLEYHPNREQMTRDLLEENPPNAQFVSALARQNQDELVKYCQKALDLKKEDFVLSVLDKLYEAKNVTGMMNLVNDSGLGFKRCPVSLIARVQRGVVELAKKSCFGSDAQTEALLKYPTYNTYYPALLREYQQERKKNAFQFKAPSMTHVRYIT